MKKKLFVLTFLIFVGGLLLVGCKPKPEPTKPTPVEPSVSEPSPSPTPSPIPSPITSIEVEFVVSAPIDTQQVFLVGSMNGWDVESAIAMTYRGGFWRVTLTLDFGVYEYKYVNDRDWGYVEKDASGEEIDNRTFTLDETGITIDDIVQRWATLWEPIIYYDVRFYVNGEQYGETIQVLKGESVPTPEEPTLEGFQFGGWSKSLDNIQSDLDIFAIFDEYPSVLLNGVSYSTLEEALLEAPDNATITLTNGNYHEPIHVTSNNLTIQSMRNHIPVITNTITLAENVTGFIISGTEFTKNARIKAEGSLVGFVFEFNKVYDINGSGEFGELHEKGAIDAFIDLHTDTSTKITAKVSNSQFNNVGLSAISIGNPAHQSKVTINNNDFVDVKNVAVRIDGETVDGTFDITGNVFDDRSANESLGSILFTKTGGTNRIEANIERNMFYSIGDPNYETAHAVKSSAIIFHDAAETTKLINIKNNSFSRSTNDIHIDNSKLLFTANINENIFENTSGMFLSQTAIANGTEVTNSYFKQNLFIGKVGFRTNEVMINHSDIGQKLLKYNTTTAPLNDEVVAWEKFYTLEYIDRDIFVLQDDTLENGHTFEAFDRTWTIGTNAFTTIQQAVNKATNGQTIYVHSGTYDEDVTITKSLNIVGINRGRRGYDPTRSSEAILTGTITLATNFINVNGFKFDNGGRVIMRKGIRNIALLNNIMIENHSENPNSEERGVVNYLDTTGNNGRLNHLGLIGNKFVGNGTHENHPIVQLTDIDDMSVLDNLIEGSTNIFLRIRKFVYTGEEELIGRLRIVGNEVNLEGIFVDVRSTKGGEIIVHNNVFMKARYEILAIRNIEEDDLKRGLTVEIKYNKIFETSNGLTKAILYIETDNYFVTVNFYYNQIDHVRDEYLNISQPSDGDVRVLYNFFHAITDDIPYEKFINCTEVENFITDPMELPSYGGTH